MEGLVIWNENQGCYLVCRNEPLWASFLEEVIEYGMTWGGAPVGTCPLGPALHLWWQPSFCMCECPSSVWMCSHFICTICDIVASSHGRVGNETGQMNEQCFQGKVTLGCLLYDMCQYGAIMLWHRHHQFRIFALFNVIDRIATEANMRNWWWPMSQHYSTILAHIIK